MDLCSNVDDGDPSALMSCNLWMCGLQLESKRFASCEGYSRKNCGSGDPVGV